MAENRDQIMHFYFSLPFPMGLKKRVADAIEKKLGNTNLEVNGRYKDLGNIAKTLHEQIKGKMSFSNIEFPSAVNPKVSIIIPAYNNIDYTLTCIMSIYNNTGSSTFEIIIVDDNSSDATKNISCQIRGLKYLRNEINLGFIQSCNNGANAASGDYLVFLNNDTVVTANWLDELIRVFQIEQNAGIVGSKLIYPDGRLQEAGGIVWRDGAAWNYGHGDDPAKPQYNYVREADYCSGACIAISKDLFKELGGFDKRYVPAYYDDADLAFQVRAAGKKVFYQPLSKIIHFEGISSGTDTSYGIKSFQIKNQLKFFERWEHSLKKHRPYNTLIEREKERNVNKFALIIDSTTVAPDQDAYSSIVYNYMRIFRKLGYKVTFAPSNLAYSYKYTPGLQRSGIECLYTPYVDKISSHLKKYGKQYDVVFLARADTADRHIDDVKRYCHNAFVIFDTVDLHFLREMREAALQVTEKRRKAALQAAEKRKEQELSIMSKADLTIVVSSVEYDILRGEIIGRRIENIHPPFEILGNKTDFEDRNGIAFVGGYQHTPNVDAVKYFVKEIFPHIKSQLSDVCFYVIGSKPSKEVMDLATDNIVVIGYVKDMAEYLNSVRLTVAPLRYGAGIKGKIITSLCYGVPVVTTSIGAEGMGLTNNEDVLIVDLPEQFASSVVKLYSDNALWNRLSENGLEKVRKNYSLESAKEKLESFIGLSVKLF
jgi:GT2 family glycosyltransferase